MWANGGNRGRRVVGGWVWLFFSVFFFFFYYFLYFQFFISRKIKWKKKKNSRGWFFPSFLLLVFPFFLYFLCCWWRKYKIAAIFFIYISFSAFLSFCYLNSTKFYPFSHFFSVICCCRKIRKNTYNFLYLRRERKVVGAVLLLGEFGWWKIGIILT